MLSRMLLSLLLCAVFQASAAQPDLAAQEDRPPRARTTVAIGQYQSEFFFVKGDSNFVYGYVGPAPALLVQGDKSSASLAYGTQPADSARQQPGQRYLDLSLQTGDNLYLTAKDDPVRVYVPVRLQLGYQGVKVNTVPLGPEARSVRTLHLIHTGLGAGGGVRIHSPSSLPVVGSRGQVRASWLTTLGGVRDAEQDLSAMRFTRTTDVDLELQVNRVFGTALGLAVGYTYRAHQWYAGSVSTVRDVFGGLHAGSVDQRSQQHILRLGVVL